MVVMELYALHAILFITQTGVWYAGIVTQTYQKSVKVQKRPTFKNRAKNNTGLLFPAHLQNNGFILNQTKPNNQNEF